MMTHETTPPKARIIVALDFPDAAAARALLARLDANACGVKIGKELFTVAGPDLVRECVARGFRVFLDLKFHDIPNTVAQACAAATRLGVWMLNVHASGGAAMLAAASEAVERAAREGTRPAPVLIAITVLTSLSDAELPAIGVSDTAERQVLRLARLAQSNRLAGVVCSPHETATLRAACGPDFKLVTPGIRLDGAKGDDQARIATPEAAIRAGADYLVIGRPITRSPDPRAALAAIRASIGEGA
jgi:orotidine-5'-phosphate decarboxylase